VTLRTPAGLGLIRRPRLSKVRSMPRDMARSVQAVLMIPVPPMKSTLIKKVVPKTRSVAQDGIRNGWWRIRRAGGMPRRTPTSKSTGAELRFDLRQPEVERSGGSHKCLQGGSYRYSGLTPAADLNLTRCCATDLTGRASYDRGTMRPERSPAPCRRLSLVVRAVIASNGAQVTIKFHWSSPANEEPPDPTSFGLLVRANHFFEATRGFQWS